MLSSVPVVRSGLLERILGTSNYNIVLAVSANIVSWIVATLLPSKIPRLLPFIPEEETKEVPSNDGGNNIDSSRTKCVAVGRPGGMEQLRIIRLKQGYVTCGYNLPGYDSPFVDVSDDEKFQISDGTTTTTTVPLVVLRVCAFSINYADCCIRWGLYESANRFVGYPIVPGFDVSGVVERVIPTSSSSTTTPLPFKVGDRVYGATFFGAYSTRCLIPSNQLRKMPEGMSFVEAAALPAVSLTALYALHLGGRFSIANRSKEEEDNSSSTVLAPSNRSILIHSAAGGVGSMLVQMAKLLGLSPVVGVVGRTSKVDEAKALGCDVVIDKQRLREESVPMWESIRGAGPPDGFSIISDPNGVSTLQDSFDHLSPAGRLVAFGFHSNLPMGRDSLNPMEWIRMINKAAKMPTFDPMELVTSNKSVMGFNLSFFVNEIEMLDAMYDQIESWWINDDGSKGIRSPRITEMAMDDIGEAHQLIQSGKTVGKLVMIAADNI